MSLFVDTSVWCTAVSSRDREHGTATRILSARELDYSLGLSRAASLDHHFAVYRFGPGGKRAFAIVRQS